MWVASFLRLILASRYQVGVWPIEVFPHSQTHDLAKDLAISQDLSKVTRMTRIWGSERSKSGVLRGQNLGFLRSQKVPESCRNHVIFGYKVVYKTGLFLGGQKVALFVVCAGSE